MTRALLLVALLLGAGGAGFALSGPCGWVGRVAGGGGCLAAFALRDLVVTGDALVTDAQGRLVIGGIDYRPGRRDRLQAQMVVATLDSATGAESARADLGMQGRPEQLRLSPDGTAMAISCNALYTCDLPGGSQPRETRVMLFDRDGERRWFAGIEHRHAPPDADGRAFELGFSPSGNVVFAHVAFDAASGQVILTRQHPSPDPNARLPAGAEIRPGATRLALDLPALGDNPAAVPVRVHLTEPVDEALFCQELIVLAQRNPLGVQFEKHRSTFLLSRFKAPKRI